MLADMVSHNGPVHALILFNGNRHPTFMFVELERVNREEIAIPF